MTNTGKNIKTITNDKHRKKHQNNYKRQTQEKTAKQLQKTCLSLVIVLMFFPVFVFSNCFDVFSCVCL
jgi:lipopolysaccharide/colanic/teichoic acid biosynthesis glycosyltransferase